ncbi:MAG: penicillin-binding protein 2 [Candidatus Omnitrophota bacterium]|nr:penicillin-binding protein 2 [Candidatus Omnitrophota bacterium]
MDKRDNLRINYIYICFVLLFFLISLRIIYLQVFRKNFFQNLAQNQYYRLIPFSGKRGCVFDCKGRVLATEINTHSVFADPAFIDSIERTAEILSVNLNVPEGALKEKLSKKKRFVWVKRKIPWNEKEKVKALKLKGIGFLRERKMFYPQESLASSLLGITDIDNKGLDGLELFYDKHLRGKDGMVRVLQDSASREIILTPAIISPQEGRDIILTIDSQIQYWVENYLEETIKKFSAKEGSVIVMNTSTGEILALANYPTFNPNDIKNISSDLMRNRAVCDMFEPGSVFKAVTLVAAIDQNKFRDTDQIFCENGAFKIPGSTLHDWKPYGTLNFREVFKKSSNIGVGKIANSLGKPTIYAYIKKLGFGEHTGIDVPGEIRGDVKPLFAWSNTSGYIIPIGQEIGVNLIQLARAFSVIANGGYLVRPHIVKTIYSQTFHKDFTAQSKRVISASTAERARGILIEVVDDGTGKLANIPGVKIGGKTGTAQKYDPVLRRYSPTKYQASFVGFISDLDPPIVIGVSISEPRKSHFGGVVAAPLFKKIAQMCMGYLGVQRHLESNAEISVKKGR